MNLKDLCSSLIELSESVGKFLQEEASKSIDIELKSLNNLVSYVDKEAEKRFVDGLQKLLPEAGFIAEEGTGVRHKNAPNWIIDPLDGTTNFLHGIPFYCTSVALLVDDEVVLGVIHDPVHQHSFYAYKGGGAFLNGNPISCTSNKELSEALLATGFPYDDFGKQDAYLEVLKDFTHKTRGLRRLGSAAMDLAYVAWGKFDGFYEYGLNPWDVAAGIIIVQEAGGKVSAFKENASPLFHEEILATNEGIHENMLKVINTYFN
ncbi:MAG: inositol monophosphatase family protein [Flavobacteriales bacterium]|nr:inositol monophosphatase family protein [Flavobacteriales bacterium]MDG1766845.1 inositol monophosphatase family protein [Flavobacteriales bacterium]